MSKVIRRVSSGAGFCAAVVSERKSSHYAFDSIVPTWYNNLPVRVLVAVFSFFDENQLRKCIMLVCKQWKFAAQRPILWKKFSVRGQHVPTLFICRKIRDFPYLQELRLHDIIDPVTVIRQVCRCTPAIKALAFRHCPPIPENSLRYIIKSCTKLEELDLSGTEFQGRTFYKELAGLECLKKLNLSNNKYLSVRNLLTAVLNCRNLEDLRVSSLLYIKEQLSDEDASLIISNICDGLSSLSLDTSSLSSSAFQTIFNCSKLERLGLYGATNLPGDLFAEIWRRFPKIKQLKIRQGHQISESNITELFTVGNHVMRNLILLDLTACWKITDQIVEVITECCPKLGTLCLKSCKRITDASPIRRNCLDLSKLNIAFIPNLKIDKLFPLPSKLNTLLISVDRNFETLQNLLEDYRFLDLRVCTSEYRKCIQKFLRDWLVLNLALKFQFKNASAGWYCRDLPFFPPKIRR